MRSQRALCVRPRKYNFILQMIVCRSVNMAISMGFHQQPSTLMQSKAQGGLWRAHSNQSKRWTIYAFVSMFSQGGEVVQVQALENLAHFFFIWLRVWTGQQSGIAYPRLNLLQIYRLSKMPFNQCRQNNYVWISCKNLICHCRTLLSSFCLHVSMKYHQYFL